MEFEFNIDMGSETNYYLDAKSYIREADADIEKLEKAINYLENITKWLQLRKNEATECYNAALKDSSKEAVIFNDEVLRLINIGYSIDHLLWFSKTVNSIIVNAE